MAKKVALEKIITTEAKVLTDKSVQKVIFGEYSDGTPRSLVDSWNGETLSPKEKKKTLKKKGGKKKNKKKKIKF